MFKEMPEGETHSCSHENTNESGVCDKCLGVEDKQEEWEKRFEELSVDWDMEYVNKEQIKSFIKSLRAKDRDTLVEGVDEKIKNYGYAKDVIGTPTMYLIADLEDFKQIILEVYK